LKSASNPSAIAVAAGCLAFAAAAGGALEISPRNPMECDVITLRIQRSFTEDCLWEVAPRVRRDKRRIDVTLQLRGRAACDQALTDRTFEVPIGSFPAGTYRLSARWSDSEVVESKRLTIGPARSERK
jgi:hypothetical protein